MPPSQVLFSDGTNVKTRTVIWAGGLKVATLSLILVSNLGALAASMFNRNLQWHSSDSRR
jgi:hypothetical protein